MNLPKNIGSKLLLQIRPHRGVLGFLTLFSAALLVIVTSGGWRVARGANVSFTFTNSVNQPDTNWFLAIPVSGPVAYADGSFTTIGVPIRITPNANGFSQTNLAQNNYLITNRFLGQGYLIRVPLDNGATVYPSGQLAISGFNTFVTTIVTNGTIQSLTYNIITNVLGQGQLLSVTNLPALTNNFTTFSDVTNIEKGTFPAITNNYTTLVYTNPAQVLYTNSLPGLTNGFVPASITNGLAGTNFAVSVTNNHTTLVFTNPATVLYTNSLPGLTNGFVPASITNGLAGTNVLPSLTNGYSPLVFTNVNQVLYTNSLPGLTNGFVTAAVTNGLAGTNFAVSVTNGHTALVFTNVNQVLYTNSLPGLTNGFVTAAVTNGLAGTNYAVSVTNGYSPLVFTNVNQVLYTNSLPGLTNGFVPASITNGLAGTNVTIIQSNYFQALVGSGSGISATTGTNISLAMSTNVAGAFTNGLAGTNWVGANFVLETNGFSTNQLLEAPQSTNAPYWSGTNLSLATYLLIYQTTNAVFAISSGSSATTNGPYVWNGSVYSNSLNGGYISNNGVLWQWKDSGNNTLFTKSTLTGTWSVVGGTGPHVSEFGARIRSDGLVFGGWLNMAYATWLNAILNNPVLTNGVNYGNAFSSPGQTGIHSEEFGNSSLADGNFSFAAGYQAYATNVGMAVGSLAIASNASAALGFQASAITIQDVAVGDNALASGGQSVAEGFSTKASGTNSIAVGSYAFASGSNSISIGHSFPGNTGVATGANSVTLGNGAVSGFDNSIAIGNNSSNTASGQVMLGSPGSSTFVPNTLTVSSNASFGGSYTNISFKTNLIGFASAGTSATTNASFEWIPAQNCYSNRWTGWILTNNSTAWNVMNGASVMYSLNGSSPIGTYSAVAGAGTPYSFYTVQLDHNGLNDTGFLSITNLSGLFQSFSNSLVGAGSGNATNAILLLNGYGTNTTLFTGGTFTNIFNVIDGGQNNTLTGVSLDAILSGQANTIHNATESVIAGGINNTVTGGNVPGDAIGGGLFNYINCSYSFIGGGYTNVIDLNESYGVIGGGLNNYLGAASSFIGGGQSNSINGSISTGFSAIPGGQNNKINGNWSFAAGNNVNATNDRVFAWSDGKALNSTTNSQVLLQATNGVAINTNTASGSALNVFGNLNAISDTIPLHATGQATNLVQSTNYIFFYAGGTSIVTNGEYFWNGTANQYSNSITGSIITNNGSVNNLYDKQGGTVLYSSSLLISNAWTVNAGSAPAAASAYGAAFNRQNTIEQGNQMGSVQYRTNSYTVADIPWTNGYGMWLSNDATFTNFFLSVNSNGVIVNKHLALQP